MKVSEIKPFKLPGPGDTVQEYLDKMGWNQETLAEVAGFSKKHINDIIKNKKAITLDTAILFESIFDEGDAKFWISLDANYRIALQREVISDKVEKVNKKLSIHKYLPVKELFKRKWLRETKDIDELMAQVKSFFNKDDLNFLKTVEPEYLPNFSKSDSFKQSFNEFSARAWHRKAEIEAEKINVGDFNKDGLDNLYNHINIYTQKDDGIERFLQEMGEFGVKFLFLPHLQKTYIDGATFIDKDCKPVIVYTGRHNRLDNFWFTLAHELAHIFLHLDLGNPQGELILDNTKDNHKGEKDEREREANQLATKKLLSNQILDFFAGSLNYVKTQEVKRCAKQLNIHPAIIVGTLAFHGYVSYAQVHKFNDTIRDKIPEKYSI